MNIWNVLLSSFAAFAEYILMKGSESYSPFMDQMQEKINMSKIVIEFLVKTPEATYEDLLNKIQVGSHLTLSPVVHNHKNVWSFLGRSFIYNYKEILNILS